MITRRDFIVTTAATASSPLAVNAAEEPDVRLNSMVPGACRIWQRKWLNERVGLLSTLAMLPASRSDGLLCTERHPAPT